MKNLVILFSVATLMVAGIIMAQKKTVFSYEKQWQKIEELAGKQLPESALKELDAIVKQATNEKNVQQLIKATIYKMRFTLEKDPDKAPQLIKDFESYAEKTKDINEKSLLYSMTAELYAQYYQNNLWTINKRTEVVGFVPEDIKEWTKNIYFDKISKLLTASLSNATQIQKTDVLMFAALLEKGEDSRTMQPTLFDLLAIRRIEILQSISNATNIENPVDTQFFADVENFTALKLDEKFQNSVENQVLNTFQQLLAFRLKENNPTALLWADLKRLEYVRTECNLALKDELYLNALILLKNKYINNEVVVEVMAEEAKYFQQKQFVDKTAFRKANDICVEGLKRFPGYRRIDLLKNIQSEISMKKIDMNYKNVSLPDNEYEIQINCTNIYELELRVYKLDVNASDYYLYRQDSQSDKFIHPSAIQVESRTIILKNNEDFNSIDTTVIINTGTYGIYEFTVSEKQNNNLQQTAIGGFTVTSLTYINRKIEKGKTDLYILDRKSGQPISKAKVDVRNQKWTGSSYSLMPKSILNTDQKGYCSLVNMESYSNFLIFIENGNDKYFCNNMNVYFYENNKNENVTTNLNILTDRSIYRPGQTVYFKGISYFLSRNRQEVNKNAEYEISLYDANNQKVSSKKFKTNEFGSFAGEFVLPQGGLNGNFLLRSGNFSQTIWVEEYKRPTFEVTIPKPESEINFGRNITIKGNAKAFAGYDISNATVRYKIARRRHLYSYWIEQGDRLIQTNNLKTDEKGNFEFNFVPQKPENAVNYLRGNIYTYVVMVDVTNTNGETQSSEMSFSVGDKALFIVATVPDKIEKSNSVNINVITETINGEKIDTKINYILYSLVNPDHFMNNKSDMDSLKVKSQVIKGEYNTSDKKLLLSMQKQKSGMYRLILFTKDKYGNEVKSEHNFVLYSKNDSSPAMKTYVWLEAVNTVCEPGENAIVRFGTSTKNTKVLFEIMQGNIMIESRWVDFNNSIKAFNIPFKDLYGDGVNINFTFMKDDILFNESLTITRKLNEKKLTPKFSVLRNKLLPGEVETWTVTIPGAEKNSAELLTTMYDASLDMLRPHSWFFNPVYSPNVTISPVWNSYYSHNYVAYANFFNENYPVVQLSFDQLNWFGLNLLYNNRQIRIRGAKTMIPNGEISVLGNESEPQFAMTGAISESTPNQKTRDLIEESDNNYPIYGLIRVKSPNPVQVRTNFNETAFFYPQLRTDAQGNVKFTFTAPESLTRWNVKMLAHTPDLYFGQGDTQVVTQKDLMVQMNLPRFVRRSDKLILSANVINLTEKELKANVTFELIDPATEKPIKLKDAAAKQIVLKANETKVVEWAVSEFSELELVICKMIAESGNFSDGEQKYLPVLPDKVLVTESMPLTIRGNQTRTFNFESLLKNGSKVDTKNLSVEFSSNPAWYAVQALPTLSAPENDNALDYFTAYYANSLATFIANSNPKIAKVFDQWKNAKSSRDALISNLQKNAELKNMLLEETPWVMAAKDETEQKRQIALLFDLNMQKNQVQQYLDKLMKLQNPNGGFAWFEGMPESRYITQEILLNLARLNRLTGQQTTDDRIKTVLTKALSYLDLEISRDFAELKKYNKNYAKENCIGNIQLFYLHMRSEYPEIPVHEAAIEAVKFYTAQSEKYWSSFTLYGKAMMAVVAHRNGKAKIANNILKSLKENALKTDELGMYWAKNTSGYFWNERPIAVQAAIIEAYAEISKNIAEIDEMKIWLLKQKQTQRWDSPTATVNAIYALLLQGSDWLSNEGSVKIELGNKTLQPTSKEAGTGYFKETIPVVNVRPSMGKITVTKSDKGIGWGAMYWQYFQDQDKIQGQSGALKVTKKLFVKQGTTMIPIEQAELKKGDKIITRLVVTTDRNLEFVGLKDLRASCLEPVNQRSGCEWKESVCYYQTTKDASTQFFFSYLPKGTYVFEYELWANNSGTFTSGIASIQCQYAPEFVSHTGGEKINVK